MAIKVEAYLKVC